MSWTPATTIRGYAITASTIHSWFDFDRMLRRATYPFSRRRRRKWAQINLHTVWNNFESEMQMNLFSRTDIRVWCCVFGVHLRSNRERARTRSHIPIHEYFNRSTHTRLSLISEHRTCFDFQSDSRFCFRLSLHFCCSQWKTIEFAYGAHVLRDYVT